MLSSLQPVRSRRVRSSGVQTVGREVHVKVYSILEYVENNIWRWVVRSATVDQEEGRGTLLEMLNTAGIQGWVPICMSETKIILQTND